MTDYILDRAIDVLKAHPQGLFLQDLAKQVGCHATSLSPHVRNGIEKNLLFKCQEWREANYPSQSGYQSFIKLTVAARRLGEKLTADLFNKKANSDWLATHLANVRMYPNHFAWSINMGGCHE